MGVDANEYGNLGKLGNIIAKKKYSCGSDPGRQAICSSSCFQSVLACCSCKVLEAVCDFHVVHVLRNSRFYYI